MHYGLELGILLKGRLRRYYREGQINVTPGQFWLCGMWEPHGYQISKAPGEAVVMIIFPPVLARTHLDQLHGIRWLAPFETSPLLRPQVPDHLQTTVAALGESIKQTITGGHKNKNAWLKLKLTEAILLLLDDWVAPIVGAEHSPDSPATINKALRMVLDSKLAITTQAAAAACTMNRNTFGRIFRETMGIRFSEFSLRYRMNSAAEQLLASDAPVKSIAAEWGFTDSSHLHRCFRRYYGCSPSEYRAKGLPKNFRMP